MASPVDVRPTNPTPLKAGIDNSSQVQDSTLLDVESSPGKEAVLDATLLDVTGQPRKVPVPKPAVLSGSRPGEQQNTQVQ